MLCYSACSARARVLLSCCVYHFARVATTIARGYYDNGYMVVCRAVNRTLINREVDALLAIIKVC